MFPERPHAWVADADAAAALLPLLYLPALLLGVRARVGAVGRVSRRRRASAASSALDRLELLYLAAGLIGGLAIMIRALGARALGDRAPAAALDRLGHHRSARCRSRSVYGLPYVARLPSRGEARRAGRAARPRAARLRLRGRPLSPDGRRGDHQAHGRLRGRPRGDRGHLRHAAAARERGVPRRLRTAQLGHRDARDAASSCCSRRW